MEIMNGNGDEEGSGSSPMKDVKVDEMTSRDYYFDSYAHFG